METCACKHRHDHRQVSPASSVCCNRPRCERAVSLVCRNHPWACARRRTVSSGCLSSSLPLVRTIGVWLQIWSTSVQEHGAFRVYLTRYRLLALRSAVSSQQSLAAYSQPGCSPHGPNTCQYMPREAASSRLPIISCTRQQFDLLIYTETRLARFSA